jgi:hypothetical protein
MASLAPRNGHHFQGQVTAVPENGISRGGWWLFLEAGDGVTHI